MPGVDIVPTRAGPFDWHHGVPVRATVFREAEEFFSLSDAATTADFSTSQKWLIVFSGTPRVRAC
jgi:hypothetical protein